MIRLIVTRRHVIQALLDNPETLAHFLNPDRAAVVTIPVDCDGNVKLEVFITAIRSVLTVIPFRPVALSPGPVTAQSKACVE